MHDELIVACYNAGISCICNKQITIHAEVLGAVLGVICSLGGPLKKKKKKKMTHCCLRHLF